jgi:hypothetical protein
MANQGMEPLYLAGIWIMLKGYTNMNHPIKIAIIRGAGLSFPIASVCYLLSGNLFAFAMVLFGAGMGCLVGIIMQSDPKLNAKIRTGFSRFSAHPPGRSLFLSKYLAHPNLIIRFAGLLGIGFFIFLLAWCIGYIYLPEGVFRASANVQMSRSGLNAESANIVDEWIKILGANLLPVLFILLGSLLIRVNGISFGHFVALYNLTGYGLFVGTNSFAMPYPERMAPSLEILSRSGPYEMIALLLLASATYFWPRYEVKRIFLTSPERVSTGLNFSWKDALGIGLGIGILMVANWIEAVMIMNS